MKKKNGLFADVFVDLVLIIPLFYLYLFLYQLIQI